MKTPELQPEANLKNLEQEVALTGQEIQDFQKLTPEEQEKQKQRRLAKLLDLQNKLEQAVTDGAKAGNFEEAKKLKEEIEKEISDLEQVVAQVGEISTEYKYKDEEGKEIVETIEIDFAEKLDSVIKFYKNHKIKIPADFAEQVQDIWDENREAIQEQIEKFGFDEIIIVPAGIKLDNGFDEEMTSGYKKSDDSKGEPTYWDVAKWAVTSDARSSKNRIILVHKNKALDLVNNEDILPILKETLDKEAGSFKSEEGLTIEEYLIFQRMYFEETGNHLDGGKGAIWLPGSMVDEQVVRVDFHPYLGRIGVWAYNHSVQDPSVGCRLAHCFCKK